MKKNRLQTLLTALVMVAVVFSCKKSDTVTSDDRQTGTIESGVKEQIRLAQENMASKQLPAKIISYKFESAIRDDNEVAAIQQKLVNESLVVPEFNGLDVSSFSVSTIKERMSNLSEKNADEGNVVQNIQKIAFPEIRKGQNVLDILWESKGKQFHSTCIYNAEGIVYDNMLSNIILLEAKSPQEEMQLSADLNAPGAVEGAQAQYHFTSTVLDYTIKWIWGGTRGKIIIKHYIIWNGVNYIIDHGGTTDAWMSAGSASARWANNYLSRNSRSKMAWGYGWATPTASFNISFNSSNLTFSTGTSGVGSKGSGSGVHTIYLP